MAWKKKASLQDVFFILLFMVVMAIVILTVYVIHSKVNTAFQANQNIAPTSKEIMTSASNRFVSLFDGVFALILILLWGVAIFLASQVDANPIFLPFSLILYILLIFLSAVMGNLYYDYASNAEVASYADDFTIIPFVMNNYVQVILVIGLSVGVVLYAKSTA